MGRFNILLNGELGGLDDEIHAAVDPDGKLMGEEVNGPALTIGGRDVVGEYPSHCGRNANGTEFGGVVGVFVDTEQVGVCEVAVHFGRQLGLEDEVEKATDGIIGGCITGSN